MKKKLLEIDDIDRSEVAHQIADGNTSGIVDNGPFRISWKLDMEKFRR